MTEDDNRICLQWPNKPRRLSLTIKTRSAQQRENQLLNAFVLTKCLFLLFTWAFSLLRFWSLHLSLYFQKPPFPGAFSSHSCKQMVKMKTNLSVFEWKCNRVNTVYIQTTCIFGHYCRPHGSGSVCQSNLWCSHALVSVKDIVNSLLQHLSRRCMAASKWLKSLCIHYCTNLWPAEVADHVPSIEEKQLCDPNCTAPKWT